LTEQGPIGFKSGPGRDKNKTTIYKLQRTVTWLESLKELLHCDNNIQYNPKTTSKLVFI